MAAHQRTAGAMVTRDTLVPLSGGTDSTVALAAAIADGRRPAAITFLYGQAVAGNESAAARAVASHYHVPHEVVILPDIQAAAEASNYVPGRNAMMLTAAAAIAEARGAKFVTFGGHRDDYQDYPDCRPQFITALNQLLAVSARTPVWVHAPFTGLSKAEVLNLGVRLGAPLHLTWSCYRAGSEPCGVCNACKLRREAETT